ncbi:EF hand [Moraxella lacunata]|uniref:EF hand n=1 Tax=Moraxella lacunata TaxID=477 RepID=A0A378T8V7_MORLA|nr:EF-hand domain-containing protein [Moraxella lacunata]STZ56285.1 EF hand [Moraxella lacunata]
MKKLLLTLVFALSAPTAFACSAISPEFGFVHQFDKNQDGQLSRAEFVKIKQADDYQLDFKPNKRAFNRLDKNKDGQLSPNELADKVDYVRHPCANWEEMMVKMLEEERANRIEVHKSDGSRQCADFAIDPETMAKELDGITIYDSRKDQLDRMYPSVCGGGTGSVNVFTIDKADLEKAQQLGFEIFEK